MRESTKHFIIGLATGAVCASTIWLGFIGETKGAQDPERVYGPVNITQQYEFNEKHTVSFELVAWRDITDRCKSRQTKHRRKYLGCIAPAVKNNRHILIENNWRAPTMRETVVHECDHLVYGPDHVFLELKRFRNSRGGTVLKWMVPTDYSHSADTADPQFKTKLAHKRACINQFDTFLESL